MEIVPGQMLIEVQVAEQCSYSYKITKTRDVVEYERGLSYHQLISFTHHNMIFIVRRCRSNTATRRWCTPHYNNCRTNIMFHLRHTIFQPTYKLTSTTTNLCIQGITRSASGVTCRYTKSSQPSCLLISLISSYPDLQRISINSYDKYYSACFELLTPATLKSGVCQLQHTVSHDSWALVIIPPSSTGLLVCAYRYRLEQTSVTCWWQLVSIIVIIWLGLWLWKQWTCHI
jgi:hypothetical protein